MIQLNLTRFLNAITTIWRKNETTITEQPGKPEEAQLAVDVFEQEDVIYIVAPLAGVKLEEVEIELENDVLTIKGKRSNQRKVDFKKYITQECFWGNFTRAVILPNNIKAAKIKATFRQGVLEIAVPKMEKIKTKNVKIEVR